MKRLSRKELRVQMGNRNDRVSVLQEPFRKLQRDFNIVQLSKVSPVVKTNFGFWTSTAAVAVMLCMENARVCCR